MKKKINYREILGRIAKENSGEIEKLLTEKMKGGPPEKTMKDSFRETLEKQRPEKIPESLEDAIAYTPMTTIVGIDQKTKRPMYLVSIIADAIQSG